MIELGNARQGGMITRGYFTWAVYDGRPRKSTTHKFGQLLRTGGFPNGMTTEGLTSDISVAVCGGTQVPTWYMGLVDDAGWSAFALGDTMGSHAGWDENQAYNEGTRPAMTFAAAAGGIAATSAPCSFTINDTIALKGAFMTSINTKGETTGILRATGPFGNVQNLVAGQLFTSNYNTQNSAS